jgi:enoyl-CoA hydratase/carnithine racemase
MNAMSVRVERQGALALLRLDKARGNAMDEPLIEALTAAAHEAARDDTVRGILLCSAHPKIFCPGLDLVALQDYDASALGRFMARFAKMVWTLYGLWKPVVAAVNGAAVAGGCILAMTADERVLKRGALIGLNEIKIGVPLPWSVSVLMRATLPPSSWTEVALAGSNFADDAALQMGLAQSVLEAKGFEQAAIARLERLAEKDPASFAITKRCLREGFLAEMMAQEQYRTGDFVTAWFSEGTRERRRQIVATLTKSDS